MLREIVREELKMLSLPDQMVDVLLGVYEEGTVPDMASLLAQLMGGILQR